SIHTTNSSYHLTRQLPTSPVSLTPHPSLHSPPSSPTRRSSDLHCARATPPIWCWSTPVICCRAIHLPRTSAAMTSASRNRSSMRSEEHTSELQSRFDLVCRLLLEKKKRQTGYDHWDLPTTSDTA